MLSAMFRLFEVLDGLSDLKKEVSGEQCDLEKSSDLLLMATHRREVCWYS